MKLFGISLGEGNTKVRDVFTFSLPSKTTCPGASSWCLTHCYAARYETIRPSCQTAYQNNLSLVRDIPRFTHTMIGILPRIMRNFRLHVSGDFDSALYVTAWQQICRAFPQTRFWGYTRSWVVPEMREALERLRDLPNMQLIASTDATMPLPPEGWRVAFVLTDPRARGMFCNSQAGEEDSCLACGYCFDRDKGNVIFKVH
jgi:hypothetical protein